MVGTLGSVSLWHLCIRGRSTGYYTNMAAGTFAFDGSRTSASGHGCFGKGTEIRLANGKWKRVEKITINDAVLGSDGIQRNHH
ncbi:Hom_end-associated Hint [Acinetobacter bohemicus]|uniref:Hom_end-associated Hint n=1 Tax=Acinetobacter bohemicus TaxID=1435036 RepID=A0A1I6QDW9_9GAMM|nr:Hom_end-associated Hint [Acinetobacter bohemicus]